MHQSAGITTFMLLIPIGLIALGVFVALAMPAIRHARRRQEWDHAERLKALEAGRILPARRSDWARAVVCIAIGAVVPSVALIVVAAYKLQHPGGGDEVWLAPCLIGVPAIVFACRLAQQLFEGHAAAAPGLDELAGAGKERFDPDAIDVVGSRG